MFGQLNQEGEQELESLAGKGALDAIVASSLAPAICEATAQAKYVFERRIQDDSRKQEQDEVQKRAAETNQHFNASFDKWKDVCQKFKDHVYSQQSTNHLDNSKSSS